MPCADGLNADEKDQNSLAKRRMGVTSAWMQVIPVRLLVLIAIVLAGCGDKFDDCETLDCCETALEDCKEECRDEDYDYQITASGCITGCFSKYDECAERAQNMQNNQNPQNNRYNTTD